MTEMTIAQKYLYNCYLMRYSDCVEDAETLQQKAKNGDLDAQFHYAWTFAETDFSRTEEEILRLAKLNFPCALASVSGFYILGVGVKKDVREAFRLLNAAYEQEPTEYAGALARFYLEGDRGVPKDVKKGIRLCQEGAEAGETAGLITLACCYLTGKGVEKAPKRAFVMFDLLQNRHPAALASLGYCYMTGNGTKRDYALALQYNQRAADLGCAVAFYNLGTLYFYGWGVEKDNKRVLEFGKIALENGFPEANLLVANVLWMKGRVFRSLPYFWRGGTKGKCLVFALGVMWLFLLYLSFHSFCS
ncbi:MAG: tetratricopeptide repeat protein [Planctomycetia bacterium]|nr:tetratricopeptide repeat protein [Planctomycetia bacterium]